MRWTFSLEEVLLWIMDSYFRKLKMSLLLLLLLFIYLFLLQKILIDGTGVVLITCGLL